MKKTKVIRPSYTIGFKCIGGECKDSCCIGWNIDVDKLTFRKYFKTTNQLMKNEFKKYVHINQECHCQEIDYGRMNIKKNKWCPFLEEDKLCKIYKNLGEDYLSNVCYSYPRVYNVLNGVYELSMYMSCPEVINKLLSSNKPIKFLHEEIELEKHIIQSNINTNDKVWKNSPIKNLKELRDMSISTIQNRKFKLDHRLITLGNKLNNNQNNDPIIVKNKYIFKLSFFKGAIKLLDVFNEIDSLDFIHYTKILFKEFGLDNEKDLIGNAQKYENVYNNIIQPFFMDHDYLFENYLVNFMFQSNFPFSVNQNMFDGYLMMVVRYSFIMFYLTGLASVKGKITVEDVILIIQLHTKTVSHHGTFLAELLEDIQEKEFDNMDFVNLLLN